MESQNQGLGLLGDTNSIFQPKWRGLVLVLAIFLCLGFARGSRAAEAWEVVGNAGFSTDLVDNLILAFNPSTNQPYGAYFDCIENVCKPNVMKFEGSQWVMVGTPRFSTGTINYLSFAFDPATSEPYVAYSDGDASYKTTVMKFDGSEWVVVGSLGFSSHSANYLSLAFNPDTHQPYLAYSDITIVDASVSPKATVMKFNGLQWEIVGLERFSAGKVGGHISLVFNHSTNQPYVAYSECGDDQYCLQTKTTVMKFDGLQWVVVGSPRFSAGSVDYNVSLAFDLVGNQPYVAYRDGANSYKATVMKFDGSQWVAVGLAGFSAGSVNYLSLAFNPSTDQPYVGYVDYGNSGKATVMNFDGSAWNNVGLAGFSEGSAAYFSLAFNPATNQPYVAYADGANSNKATVRIFNSEIPSQQSFFSPYPYGYKFYNASPAQILLTGGIYKTIWTDWLAWTELDGFQRFKLWGTKWEIFQSTFDTTNLSEKKQLSAFESIGLDDTDAFQGGNCYGMALSSAMQYDHPDYMNSYYKSFTDKIGYNRQYSYLWDVPSIHSYTDPEGSTKWAEYNDTLKTILSFQIFQYGSADKEAEKNAKEHGLDQPNQILQELKNNPNKTYILTFGGYRKNKDGGYVIDKNGEKIYVGHAVVPYKTDGDKIYIWDNNVPYGEFMNANNQYITIENNTWKTDQYSWKEPYNIMLLDVDDLYNNGKKPGIAGFGDYANYSLSGNADLQLVDNEGRVSGFLDGIAINEIPGVIVNLPNNALLEDGASIPSFQSISVPQEKNLKIKVVGDDNGSYKLMELKNDYYVSFTDAPTDKGLQDEYEVSSDEIKIKLDPLKSGSYNLLMDNFRQDDSKTVYLDNLPSIPQQQSYQINWDLVERGVADPIVYGIDLNGDNVSDKEMPIQTIYQDSVAPTTVPSLTGDGGPGWYRSDVNVTLSATDNEGGMGVKKTEYSLDEGTTWNEYISAFTILGDGTHVVQYRSIDWFNNQEDTQLVKVNIGAAPMYRFRNKDNGSYLFTGEEEHNSVLANYAQTFTLEGIAFNVPDTGNPIYRFRNNTNGTYLFTGEEEHNSVLANYSQTFTLEGVAFNVPDTGNPIYRFRNKDNGTYLFTGEEEHNSVLANYSQTFVLEGIAFYAN